MDALLPYLRRIDEAQWYTNFGPLSRELEQRLLEELLPRGARTLHVTSVSNCTAGLELALLALKLPPGARVLLPALTFVATATAVVRAGCVPVIADVDAARWVLTPEIARAALHEAKISAVLPVAAFGAPLNPAEWDEFSDDTRLPVLIDAAGAIGNQGVGERAAVAFSLHATKALGAGEGGFVAAADPVLIEQIRRLSNFGIDISTSLVGAAGTNAKLSEYHAAVGLAALDAWPFKHARRVRIWQEYARTLAQTGVGFQDKPEHCVCSMMPVCLPPRTDVAAVANSLAHKGIETRRWYFPLIFQHAAFSHFTRVGELATARALADRLLGLPFFPQLERQDMGHVADSLEQALRECAGR